MTPEEFMLKAERALGSARLLFEAGDMDGSCNRVYYAMFDAAKAALIAKRAPQEMINTKTHSGLITAFSLHIVKQGHISIDHGQSFNRLHELRMIADYRGDLIADKYVDQAIADGSAFLDAVRALLHAR